MDQWKVAVLGDSVVGKTVLSGQAILNTIEWFNSHFEPHAPEWHFESHAS
jgi:hypothetical protein